jgi:hypothetical protein
MRSNIDLQHVVELLRNNNIKIRNIRKNPYLLNMIRDYPFFLSRNRGKMDRSIKDGPKKKSKSQP